MSTADRAIKVIATQTGKPVSAIHPHHAIRGDLLDDSLEHVELVMALEDEFGVEISDNDAAGLVTVQHVIDHIAKLVVPA